MVHTSNDCNKKYEMKQTEKATLEIQVEIHNECTISFLRDEFTVNPSFSM